MDRRQWVRVHMRALRFSAKEALIDLALVALPIFIVMGLLVAAAKFWFWLIPLGL